MSLDISKLNSFSKEVYSKIIERHPEWDKYAKVDSYKYLGGESFYLSIEIPSLVPGVFPIEITAEDDEPEEITIHFGPADRHMRWRTPPERQTLVGQIESVEEIIRGIFNEELIAIQKKPGMFFVTEGIVSKQEYKKMYDKGKLRRAVSWKGTYNYPTDGTQCKWHP